MSRSAAAILLLLGAGFAGLVVFWPGNGQDKAPSGTAGERQPTVVTVMTRNLYLGADLTPVIASKMDPEVVDAAFAAFLRTRVDQRMAAVADEIARALPVLIGLQEAAIWNRRPREGANGGDGGGSEPAVTYDSIQILLEQLGTRGLDYDLVVASKGFDVRAAGVHYDYRLTDREAVLIKADAGLTLSMPQAGTFRAAARVPGPSGPISAVRGWASVNATIHGQTFRFVTSHLSLLSPKAQVAQAEELLQGPASGDLPLVLVGDFNSAAAGKGYDTPTYKKLLDSGFTDGWTITHPREPGLTGCQPKGLDNLISSLRARIDLVLVRGSIEVRSVDRVGHKPRNVAPDLHWASDHAGLVARIQLP